MSSLMLLSAMLMSFVSQRHTWLCDTIASSEIFGERYLVFRDDRNSVTTGLTRGGGVLIAVDNTFKSKCVMLLSKIETVCVEVALGSHGMAMFVCEYFSPNSHLNTYTDFFERLEILTDNDYSAICITGDFNFPGFMDNSGSAGTARNDLFDVFKAFCALTNSRQINDVVNGNDRTLDLIFVDEGFHECDLARDLHPLVFEDVHHPALRLDLYVYHDDAHGRHRVSHLTLAPSNHTLTIDEEIILISPILSSLHVGLR